MRTVEERIGTVRRLAGWCGHSPEHLTAGDIARWLAAGEWAPSTRATYHGHLAAFFRWCVAQGVRPDDPMALVCVPRRPRGEPRPIADEQLARLIGVLNRRRTRAMVLLAALAGLRVHEIAKLRGEDVDIVARTVVVVGKGAVRATLPLHSQLVALAETMPRAGWWFPSVKGGHVRARSVGDAIRDAMVRAGVPGTAHQLRHWFGTTLVDDGADLATAQKLLRHASLATTQVYVQVADHRKAEAIGRLDLMRCCRAEAHRVS